MARKPADPERLRSFLQDKKIASLEDLKNALGSAGTMTVFRKLKELGYLSSYSHRGKFYTLQDIPEFDELGLWSLHAVWFSKYGNLVETAWEFVEESEMGYTARELEMILHVECKRALLKLYEQKRLEREKIGGAFVYLSGDPGKRRNQALLREGHASDTELGISPGAAVLGDELKAAIILFYSLLDEKQRRLYAGLEAHKLGFGGDHKIAALLKLDRHTVSKGRRELFGGEVKREAIREEGGGRKPQKKKRRK